VRVRPRPSTIRIFLADGTPEGLRIIEKSNWSGRGFDFARADWTKVRTRPDFGKPAVYVLLGPADDGGDLVYVGEADEVRSRVNMHHAGLDFWTRAVVFASKDENLNKAGVKYLESGLIRLALAAKRASLKNANAPGAPFMSEADQADAEGFLEEMLPIFPLLGLDAFEVIAAKAAAEEVPRLHLQGAQSSGYGRDTADGFIVEAGSIARPTETKSLPPFVRGIRAKLLTEGALAADAAGLKLTEDRAFSSPSTAAMVLLGRPANGRTEWSDSAGRTLKAIQEEAAG